MLSSLSPRGLRSFLTAALLALAGAPAAEAQTAEVEVMTDLSYKDGANLTTTEADRCRLDLYLPAEGTGFASILWLHGGGLTGGSKGSDVNQRVARRLAAAGIAVGMAEYRLNPSVRFPAYVTDAAAAFAWLRANIADHGGDPERVFIGGHSAGAYLALMVALDDQYLAACGLDERSLAGVVAVSGQTSTHFTVRSERHPEHGGILVDSAAPLYHVRARRFPFLVFSAANDLPMRTEENRLLASALRHAGCEAVIERVYEARDHGTVYSRMSEPGDPVAAAVIRVLREPRPAPVAAVR